MKNTVTTERILIVDDLPKNIQILGKLLSTQNREIAYALSGNEALRLVEKNLFDLILLDIMMPEMDGFEVCKILKNNPKTAEIPVIFLTAKTETDHVLKGFELGGQDYITKPFNTAELLARINTHLELVKNKKQLIDYSHNLEEIVADRTAELQIANKQLSTLEKAKSDFLSIISHELRTPLNGIIGITDLLSQALKDEEQRDYLDFLSGASKRLLRFSETALLITSLQSNDQKVELFEVSVKMLIEMLVDEMSEPIQDKNAKINISIKDDRLLIRADGELLRKSLSILLENALSKLPTSGTIKFDTTENKEEVCVEVSDNGSGFSEEILARLTELMEHDNFLVEETAGLSLAAVKLMMNAQNGSVRLFNNADGGACVSLCFKK
ncbi:MAG: hybrid sensor histidine kinase/response regulator [Bacteroidales bacterium]|jgi:two-component system sensor histidine kinase/response regulator|nr:hybrid sensor histidine kinase/response regulator [Bacteroidales bacterium]